MPAYKPAHFADVLNAITVVFHCSPAAFVSHAGQVIRHDFKPTTMTNYVITGPYGSETVRPGMNQAHLRTGGGLQTVRLGFWARRFGRGDGENWLWNFLVRLGRTDLGELVVDGVAYPNCWFVRGDGTVQPTWHTEPDGKTGAASRREESAIVAGALEFVRSMPTASGDLAAPTTAAANEIGLYGLGSNLGNYTATSGSGGTLKLGRYCDLAGVSVNRPVTVATIPRAQGVRIKGRGHTNTALATQLDYRRGRSLELRFRGYVRAGETDFGVPEPIASTTSGLFNEARARLQQRISRLQFGLSDHIWTLTGNGNMFPGCYFTSLEPEDDDQAYNTWPFNAVFSQDYHEVALA